MLGDVGVGDDFIEIRTETYKMVAPTSELNDDADSRPSDRHHQYANLGWMDGHIEARKLAQFYLAQTPANLWFSP